MTEDTKVVMCKNNNCKFFKDEVSFENINNWIKDEL